MSAEIPEKWLELFSHIPQGYDPVATASKGMWFDVAEAEKRLAFYEHCATHVKGELAGKPFLLGDWQKAIIGCSFGWKRADGTRRYREVYVLVPRKNGKSTMMAPLPLMGLTIDGEEGAEIYSAAADRMQAALVFDQAKAMALRDSELSKRLKVHKYSISNEATNSLYKPLSSDAHRQHGLNVHMGVLDEIHSMPNAELAEVIQTGTGARKQPILFYITTADYMRESFANTIYDYAKNVLEGTVDDPSFLPVVYEADVDDDWTDPTVWAKANPNLGVSVSEEYIERECKKAKSNPSYENTFRRLHLNVRNEQDIRWLQLHLFDECPSEPPTEEELLGSPCWGGLDLASTTDLTAFALYWPEFNYAKVQCWLPEQNYLQKRNQILYGGWVKDGSICITPGSAVDYGWVRNHVLECADKYRLQDIGYDPWNATQIAIQLQDEDGLNMVQFRQGFASMNEPSKALERMIVERKFNHGGDRCLRWMISNATKKDDPAGNIKPDKSTSSQKIDGVVATIMAIGRSMFSDESESVYETRGILTL
jgi:phage terminase large subunit-like protein